VKTDVKALKDHNPLLFLILSKQFQLGGYRIPSVLDDDWYCLTWTQKQEDAFHKWLVGYLMKHKKQSQDVFCFYGKKVEAEKCWLWWNLQYGFKTKEET
jgi:hypothetical protein